MKALTVRQPWASLVAAGVKTIETRSWRTAYRGRIAIHAAARPMGDGGFEVMLAAGVSPSAALTAYSSDPDYGIPLGAVVATAELVDCVPVVDDVAVVDAPYLRVFAGGRLGLRMTDVHIGDVTDQLPFGVFEPGRWAWLLDDIKHVNELCPWCWGDGVVEGEQEVRERMCLCEGGRGPHGEYPCSRCGGSAVILELLDPLMLCPVCAGDGACDPIPARGQQGLWEWKP